MYVVGEIDFNNFVRVKADHSIVAKEPKTFPESKIFLLDIWLMTTDIHKFYCMVFEF